MSKIFSLTWVYEMLLKNLTSFFSFFSLYCFDILFNSSSLLLFLLIKSGKLFFSSVMKILSEHFHLRFFFVKYFLEEKFGIQAHMACLGSYFSVAQNTYISRQGEQDDRNLVAIDFLSRWCWYISPYQSWKSSCNIAIVGIGSIAGKEPEGQIKYLGRQYARLRRCQENQLDTKERAAS